MQKTYYFILESLTAAMRGKDLLNRAMIMAQIRKTPREYSKLGCGYCIVVFSDPEKSRKILEKNSVRVLSVKEK